MIRILFLAVGCCTLLLGFVGIVLPILPTTPFLLVTAACFAKGSTRFHRWFTGTGIYRKHLEGLVNTWSMTRKAKLRVTIPVTLMMLAVMILIDRVYVRILIVIVLLVKYYFFCFKIRTIKEPMEKSE